VQAHPSAEEQVQRVEETVAVGDPQGGNPPGAGTAPAQVQMEATQNTAQGDAATPLETGTRQHNDAEKRLKPRRHWPSRTGKGSWDS
jgi:hypothetical protein